jgi:hypothetical protein
VFSISLIVRVAGKYFRCCCLALNFRLNVKMAVKILRVYEVSNRSIHNLAPSHVDSALRHVT